MDIDAIARQLKGAHRDGRGWRACCPVHQGSNDTALHLWIEGGELRAFCHVCQEKGLDHEILERLGIRFRPMGSDTETVYPYHDAKHNLLFEVVRKGGKTFRQRQPDPAHPGQYLPHIKGVSRTLYQLPRVLIAISQGKPIYIVEGEKDVDTLKRFGIVATCNPGGAEKWTQASYNEALAGADVIIIPDNDDPGRRHAEQVEKALQGNAKSIRILHLPGLPEKGDVTDWLQTHTPTELSTLAQLTTPRIAGSEVKGFEAFDSEELRGTDLPPTRWIIEGLLPEGLASLAGRPKQGKSWLALNLAIASATGTKALGEYNIPQSGSVLFLALEDNKIRIKHRMAQLMNQVIPWPDNLYFSIFSPRIGDGFTEALALWMNEHPGCTLIVVDMYTKIAGRRKQKSNQSDYDDIYEELAPLQALAYEYHVAILLVMHLNKSVDVEDATARIMGSTAYSGATVTNLILRRVTTGAGADALLTPSGKDLTDEEEIALVFESGLWLSRGNANMYQQSQQRLELLDALYMASGKETTPKDLAEATGKSGAAVRNLLKKLREDGLVGKNAGAPTYHLTNAGADILQARRTGQDGHRALDAFGEDDSPEDGYPAHWPREVDPKDFF